MTFERCSAEEFGGALYVIGGFDQQGGSVNLNTCTSGRAAGGVYVDGSFYEESGAMYFHNCTSSKQGGGMFLRCNQAGSNSCNINQSRLAFHSCSSAFGGGLSLSGALDLMHSNASFENCRAESEGGGLEVTSGSAVAAQVARLEFKQCAAGAYGGGMHAREAQMSLDNSNVTFVECTAGRQGGGFEILDGRLTHSSGMMSFHFCKAYTGAAFSSTWGAELAEVNVEMCIGLGSGVRSSMGNVSIQRLTFVYDDPSAGHEPSVMAPNVSISEVDCTATHQCSVHAFTWRIPSLLCPPGREKHSGSSPEPHHGCRLCERGYFQPLPWRNPHCLPCPSEAQACDAVSVTMQAGYMLDVPNLSSINDFSELESVKRTYFCPNAASCPGGRLAYQNQTAMCSPGATGEGCEFSTPGYSAGDYDNPFSKFKCPTARSVWVMAASYLFGKDLFVFVLASSSVLGAKAGRKESAVLVNQLMAFGIIASRCLAALMQAEVFARQSVYFRDVLHAWGIVIDAGTGQAASGTPVRCFAKAMYEDHSLTEFFSFFALANVPALLLVCVFGCAKGFWLSIIVG
ncbi:pmpB, partial [Symbiodinium necroappetens]